MRNHRLWQALACAALTAASLGLAISVMHVPKVRLAMLGGSRYDFEIQPGLAEQRALSEAAPLLEEYFRLKGMYGNGPVAVKVDGASLVVSGVLPSQSSLLRQLVPKGYDIASEPDRCRLTMSPALLSSQLKFDRVRAGDILAARFVSSGAAQPAIVTDWSGSDTKFSVEIPTMKEWQRDQITPSLFQLGSVNCRLLADLPFHELYFANLTDAKAHFGGTIPQGTELLEDVEKPGSAAPHRALGLEALKRWVLVSQTAGLTPPDFISATSLQNPTTEANETLITLSASGREANQNLTQVAFGHQRLMALLVGKQIVSICGARETIITNSLILSGHYTHHEAVAFANRLEAGMELPPIQLVQARTTGLGIAPLVLVILVLVICAAFLVNWIVRPMQHGDTL